MILPLERSGEPTDASLPGDGAKTRALNRSRAGRTVNLTCPLVHDQVDPAAG